MLKSNETEMQQRRVDDRDRPPLFLGACLELLCAPFFLTRDLYVFTLIEQAKQYVGRYTYYAFVAEQHARGGGSAR